MQRFLEHQLALEKEHFECDPRTLAGKDLTEYVRWNVLAACHELHEALDEVEWKPWKKYGDHPRITDRDHYVEELVDVLHFVGNLLLVAEVTDEELDEAYARKRAINAERMAELAA